MSNVGHVELHAGSLGVVCGVRCSDGSCPAEEFLAGLDARAQAQFMARFERLADGHGLISPDQYRQLHVAGLPVIWEIKVHAGPGWRLYGVPIKRDWIATHGVRRPKDKAIVKEVKRSRTIFLDWER